MLYILSEPQKLQNTATKLDFKTRRRDHMQLHFQALHWLPVQARIDYKLSTVTASLIHPLPISLIVSLCTPLPSVIVRLQRHGLFVSTILKPLTVLFLLLSSKVKEFSSVRSDICHIQSSCALKTASKTHFYEHCHNS